MNATQRFTLVEIDPQSTGPVRKAALVLTLKGELVYGVLVERDDTKDQTQILPICDPKVLLPACAFEELKRQTDDLARRLYCRWSAG